MAPGDPALIQLTALFGCCVCCFVARNPGVSWNPDECDVLLWLGEDVVGKTADLVDGLRSVASFEDPLDGCSAVRADFRASPLFVVVFESLEGQLDGFEFGLSG